MNIFTTTSHLDDEILKFSLMNWGYKNKPNILISQHGGNYSISNQLGLGHYDYEISKKYFTWGFKSRKNDVISNAQQIYQKVQNYNKEKEMLTIKYYIKIDLNSFKIIKIKKKLCSKNIILKDIHNKIMI